MKTRTIITYLPLLALLLFEQCTGSSGKETASESTSPPASQLSRFNTVTVEPDTLEESIELTGRVVPLQKISVVAQVQGIAQATRQPFKEGVTFRRGQALVTIDDDDFRYELSAKKSEFLTALARIMSDIKLDYPDHFKTWNAYLAAVDINKPIPEMPEVSDSPLRYFLAANNIFNLYYTLKSQEEKLRDFTIYAPFEGAVTMAQLDAGDLVMPGTKLGEFSRTDIYEVRASLPANELSRLSAGQEIALHSRTTGEQYVATVNRLGKSIDPATQSVAVYLRVRGEGLREGMYLEGAVASERYPKAVKIDKEVLTREHQVYTIQDSVVRLKTVTPVYYRQNTVIVQGLAAGDQIITDPILSPLQGTKAVSK